METRALGRSGLRLSVLGMGCGAVGGLMVRGESADQERAVAMALDAGVTYFDTAADYGAGASERALGRALRAVKPAHAVVGTKVRLRDDERDRVAAAIGASLDASLQRLGRERVDILYLHNPVGGGGLDPDVVEGQVAPAIAGLIAAGKVGLAGFTAIGATGALGRVMASGAFGAAQVVYNLLNPSAAAPMPGGLAGQDYGRLLDHAAGTGAVGIRVLAGGALSGAAERHPVASAPPAPIGSAATYDDDRAQAQRFLPLVAEGFADTLAAAAVRYAIAQPRLSTVLVGVASLDQLAQALAAAQKGPLPPPALARVAQLQA